MPAQPNPQKLMMQVQKMQADMQKAQEEATKEVVTAASGGGVVTVEVTGGLELKSVTIKPEAVDPDDVEMLQDLVVAAVNEGMAKANKLVEEKVNAAAGPLAGQLGGLGLPGF